MSIRKTSSIYIDEPEHDLNTDFSGLSGMNEIKIKIFFILSYEYVGWKKLQIILSFGNLDMYII